MDTDDARRLRDAGLRVTIEPAGSPARYEARVGDNHHHLVCRVCGDVADVDCAVGQTPSLIPAEAAGYVVDEADVTYWGICPHASPRLAINRELHERPQKGSCTPRAPAPTAISRSPTT